MSDIISLQNLVGSVSAVEQSIETTRLSVLYHSKCNNHNLSEYHLKFGELINKYSGFAEEYRSELNEFHNLLLNNIELQQEKEKEKLERLEKLEIISNSGGNLEIVDNLAEIDYSSATSLQKEEEESNNSSVDQQQQEYVEPAPAPIPAPSPIKARKSVKKDNKNRKKAIKSRKNASVNIMPNEDEKKDDKNVSNMDKPYKYNSSSIRWRFSGVHKSSTLIYIGNLPYNIKIAAIQFFVMKKAKVTMRQIEETQLKESARGMYSIVRFRSDVSIDRINKFINNVNAENNQIAELKKKESKLKNRGKNIKNNKDDKKNNKSKKETTGDNKKKSNKKTSWQSRVFLKFNNNSRFYESSEAMYNDRNAKHILFIRNFNILNRNCHYELTNKLLEFGDLYNDIDIKIDSFGDPYCIAIFKYINDAIYCCNSQINFNQNRTLEIRYSKF